MAQSTKYSIRAETDNLQNLPQVHPIHIEDFWTFLLRKVYDNGPKQKPTMTKDYV